eukprot:14093549-Alexandrium_andersonii.AAC.1
MIVGRNATITLSDIWQPHAEIQHALMRTPPALQARTRTALTTPDARCPDVPRLETDPRTVN